MATAMTMSGMIGRLVGWWVDRARDGYDYEARCGRALRLLGWKVEHVGGAGDGGVDLVCRRAGTTVGVQCKYRTRGGVDNSAVQQVYLGVALRGLDVGVVVTNAWYRLSACAAAVGRV